MSATSFLSCAGSCQLHYMPPVLNPSSLLRSLKLLTAWLLMPRSSSAPRCHASHSCASARIVVPLLGLYVPACTVSCRATLSKASFRELQSPLAFGSLESRIAAFDLQNTIKQLKHTNACCKRSLHLSMGISKPHACDGWPPAYASRRRRFNLNTMCREVYL